MKQHLGVWLPDHEAHLQGHMSPGPFGRGVYQYKKLEAALAVTSGRRVAVDIGAHVGLWSHPLSYHFNFVDAFEPMPEHCDCWALNMLGRDNAILSRKALGADYDTLRMTQPRGNTGNSRVTADGEIEVDVVPLDMTVSLGPIDLIKIDCEGYEVNVLLGAQGTIKRHRPTIIVEQKRGNGQQYGFEETEAVDVLTSWGGVVETVIAGDYIVRFP
jgi:FkbM family methyltransferase